MSAERAFFGLLGLFGLALVQAPALAQESGPGPVNTTASMSAGIDDFRSEHDRNAPPPREVPIEDHPAGTYTGVVPGTSVTGAGVLPATKAPATITWPGFQMRPDGTSRVFIQSTTSLALQPTAAAGKYSVYLPGARVHGGTNRLPLETRFFNTPVTKVSLSAAHDGVTVTLELRADVTPQVSNEQGADGYYFIYIDLPKGHYVSAVASAKPEPTASVTTPIKATPQRTSAPPSHLEDSASSGAANASGRAAISGSIDDEKPPAFKGSASGRIKLGK